MQSERVEVVHFRFVAKSWQLCPHADRWELLRLLKDLAAGDTVVVTRIDRLARLTFELFAIVKQIVGAGGQCRSLAELWPVPAPGG